MKIKLNYWLAGVILPASFITFASTQSLKSQAIEQTIARPYLIELNSAKGLPAGTFSGQSVSADPFSIAHDLGVTLDPEDKYLAFPEIRMGIGGKITVYQAPNYVIYDGKKKLERRSWAETVGEFLSEEKIELGTDDKINFSLDTKLELEMEIRIIRVALTSVSRSESIDFKTIKKEDNTLDKGKIRVEQKGKAGTRILTYLVRREDGVEVSRNLTKTEITAEPVSEIQIIGTRPVITGWCKYNDLVLDASIKNGLDPDKLCALMRKESNGHPNSVNPKGPYIGLFQYTESFWAQASKKAGFAGADIYDAKAQIYTTAWALTHGYSGRW